MSFRSAAAGLQQRKQQRQQGEDEGGEASSSGGHVLPGRAPSAARRRREAHREPVPDGGAGSSGEVEDAALHHEPTVGLGTLLTFTDAALEQQFRWVGSVLARDVHVTGRRTNPKSS